MQISRLGTNTIGNARSLSRLGDGSIISSGASAWWLSGGIDPANVVAVYQPKGAAKETEQGAFEVINNVIDATS